MSTDQPTNPNTERFRTESSDVSSDGVLGVLSAGQGGVTGKSTLAPLDLAALRRRIDRAKERPAPPGLAGLLALDALVLIRDLEGAQEACDTVSALAKSAHKWNMQERAKLTARAEAAEEAVARVEAICKDTDGNWLDPEDECNNVGGILQALRGTA